MHKRKIYLAGNISSDPATYQWRTLATELLQDNFAILNPAANSFNQALLRKCPDPEKFKKIAVQQSQGILLIKDHMLVGESNIILVNMSIITPEKPLIGTLFELAWAWDYRIPVVAIVADNWWCKHPFTAGTFSATANTVHDACDLIKYFFMEE